MLLKLSSANRYDEIREEVADFIETFGVRSYPFDIFVLLLKIGIRVVPYSSLDSRTRSMLTHAHPDAVTRLNGRLDVKNITIFYNDIGIEATRIRFTLAHELGHIWLQTDNEDEADFFANYLLAPSPLVIRHSKNSPEAIMKDFNIGYLCARAVQDRANNRIRCRKPIYDYEYRIIKFCTVKGADVVGR